MKKLGLLFTLLCFLAFYALFIAVPPASAQCTPPDDIGTCPAGIQCPSGMCCPSPDDCVVAPASATDCNTTPLAEGINFCLFGQVVCSIDSDTRFCCSTPASCDALKGSFPADAPAPAAGADTPTCDDDSGTPTALGCIPNQPAAAIGKILPWAIGLGTGLAFLLFLYGAFTLITAGSDPQKVDTGKSVITSAAAGLIFIILAIFLLRVIGINILKL